MNICSYIPTKSLDNKAYNLRFALLFDKVCYLLAHPGGGGGGLFDATVDFSVNADPNTVGTTFSPNTPALTTVLYVSTIDFSQWIYDGAQYRTYVSPFWTLNGNPFVTTNNFIGSTNNASLKFRTNNTQVAVLDTAGNFGINQTIPTEKLHVSGNVRFSGALMPNNLSGTSGQVLVSAGTGAAPTWTSSPVVTVPISSLTAATATNSINNAGYDQLWQWNSLSGSALRLNTSSTAAASNLQNLLRLDMSGANSNASQLTTTLYVSNTHTGTTPTNRALYITANSSGGTDQAIYQYAGNNLFNQFNGSTYLGLAGSNTGILNFGGSLSGTVTVQPAAAAGTWSLTLPTTAGTSGQFLQTNGSGVSTWASQSTIATAVPINGLTAATATNSIDNSGFQQTWDWSGLTNGFGLYLTNSGTGANNSTQSLLRASSYGNNSNSSQTTYTSYFSNTKTGTSSTNVAGFFLASGGTNNYAIITSGRVGINVVNPTSELHVHNSAAFGIAGTSLGTLKLSGNVSGTVNIQSAAAAGTWTMTLPTGAGTSGYVLSTDGSGVTSWVVQTGGGGLTVGTSAITSGTTTRVLYDNAGVLGEYAISGTGSVAMSNSPALTGVPTAPTAATTTNTTQIATTAFVQQELTASTVYFDSTFGGAGTLLDPIKQIAAYNPQSGTTYTLQDSDNGKVITFTNGSAIALTVPAGLAAGFNCSIVQLGTGVVTFTPSSTTVNNRQGFTDTAGQYAAASILMYTTDVFLTQGDMA